MAALSAASLVLLTTLAIGGPLMAWQQSRLRVQAGENLELAERHLANYEAQKERAEAEALEATTQRDNYKLQKERADTEALEATTQRDNTREELKQHQQTLQAYETTIRDAELLKDPRFAPLKQKLLKDGLAHWQRFYAKHRDDPQWAPDVARALYRIAHISAETRGTSKEDAITAYQEALVVYERLVRENPDNREFRKDLGGTHGNMASLYKQIGKPAEALAAQQKALEIRERLADEYPSVPMHRSYLSTSYHNTGNLYRQIGKPAEALASHQKALEIREPLAREYPNFNEFQDDLAATHNMIGILSFETGNRAKAGLFKIWG